MWEHSRIARVLQTASATLTQVREGSVLAENGARLTTRAMSMIRNSYCYRWLKAEPDPEVIVIDLQKTLTVGPFIRLLEKVFDPVERAWGNSNSSSVTTAVGEMVSDSRTGWVLATVLEPPKPPADNDEKKK